VFHVQVGATIIGEVFGLENFGKNYGLLALGPGLAGLAFNTVAAQLFDRHSHRTQSDDGEPERTCKGSVCFKQTFIAVGVCCLVGTIVSMWLIPRTRLRLGRQTLEESS